MSHLSVFMIFWMSFSSFVTCIKWRARKRICSLCEGGVEKSVPRDHQFSSLGKPCDANWWSSGGIFLSHPHTHDRFLYHVAEHWKCTTDMGSLWVICIRPSIERLRVRKLSVGLSDTRIHVYSGYSVIKKVCVYYHIHQYNCTYFNGSTPWTFSCV